MTAALTAPAAGQPAEDAVAHPELWPVPHHPVADDPAMEARIERLLSAMSIEDKVGQLIQVDIANIEPEDLLAYKLGSVLNGGTSGPYGDDKAPAADWLRLADEFYEASMTRDDGRPRVPVIWGTDAVHGNNNVPGATLFPHNIGLGATRDPDLVQRIGHATAIETSAAGQDWTFAPTVAVAQDDRWGRTYESYSEDPQVVRVMAAAMVEGLQGKAGTDQFLAPGYVVSSTKHFLADGGTDGRDQGDAAISERELIDIHFAGYEGAIEAGTQIVMASLSSGNGVKMTANRSLRTGVLKERMDFGGFVVSDWNAHGQVEGCTNESCPQALLAGVDMYMAPDTWKPIWEDLLAKAKAGEIPMSRIDEAVTRILRVKMRLGLFEAGKPSARALSGQWNLLGSPEHRALAREAVRESLVLLKNQGVLPLKPGGRLLVAGDGTDDIARQAGGWTLTWQGTGVDNSHFPGATSLWEGLRAAVSAGGGTAQLSPDGSFTQRPDAAVVIFGEKPYAEFQGDRASLQLDPELARPFETMRKLKEQGIPVVAVMITGRPLYVNPALNAADAFVVAWLPGSEGAGLADVLVGGPDGAPNFDFMGKLPTAWPRTANMADGVLYPFGYGLTYASARSAWTDLPEAAGASAGDSRTFLAAGAPASSWSLHIADPRAPGSQTRLTTFPAEALDGRAKITAEDAAVQEGARRFRISGGDAAVTLGTFEPIDVSRETNGDVLLLFTLKMTDAPDRAGVAMRSGADTTAIANVQIPAGTEFVRYGIPLKCLRDKGIDMSKVSMPFVFATSGATDFALTEVRLGTDAQVVLPCT
jgi:beta-glucosidase